MGIKINKLFNSNWNNIDYGEERTRNSEISVLPLVSEQFEDATTQDMDSLLSKRMINDELYAIFMESPYFEKYSESDKKVEKKDIPEVYFYFKDEMNKKYNYNAVDILCAICEFFDFNYTHIYNNVLSLEEKSLILEILEKDYGLQNRFKHSKKLF